MTNMSARCRKPPIRVNSTRADAIQTAASCVTTSRRRTCASSCARTPSSSAGGARASRPRETAIAEPRGPRPAASERGWPSRMTYSFGLTTFAFAARRASVECTSGASASRLLRADHPHHDPVRVPVRRDGGEQCAEHDRREQPVPAGDPTEQSEQRADRSEEQPDLQQVPGGRERFTIYPSSSRSSPSPLGGQSGSGASQRLEQWSEAMFCSGIRMWLFSSMWATSSM